MTSANGCDASATCRRRCFSARPAARCERRRRCRGRRPSRCRRPRRPWRRRRRPARVREARAVSSVNVPSAAWMNRRTPPVRRRRDPSGSRDSSRARRGRSPAAGPYPRRLETARRTGADRRVAPDVDRRRTSPGGCRRRRKTRPALQPRLRPAPHQRTRARTRARSSAGDGVATGEGSRRKRVNGSAMSSADGVTRARLSRKDGTRARTLRRKAIARAASGAFDAALACCSARYRSTTSGGHALANLSRRLTESCNTGIIAALGREAGTLDEHGGVVGLERDQRLEQALGLRVSVRSAGVLDFLNERGTGVEICEDRARLRGAGARSLPLVVRGQSRDGPSETRHRSTTGARAAARSMAGVAASKSPSRR